MDDDASFADVPAGDDVPPDPTGRPAPPTSRAIAMFVTVFLFFGLLAAAAWFVGGTAPVGCTSDAGPTDPGGVPYSRDPDQGCRFVDADGNVVPGQ